MMQPDSVPQTQQTDARTRDDIDAGTGGGTDAAGTSAGTDAATRRAGDVGPSSGEDLLTAESAAEYRTRWEAVQTAFVDAPRDAVQQADALVAEILQRVTEGFSEARAGLEARWAQGQDASTEDLRVALQRYREFFRRLLAA